jgi:hypothetical protein
LSTAFVEQKSMSNRSRSVVLLSAVLLWIAPPASSVIIDWVEIGGPGNLCDPQSQGCFGAVADVYFISRTEVTNEQYAEFLNAVAATDPKALFNNLMLSAPGGITRSGTSGSFTYLPIEDREDKPVNWVSFHDSLRFVNWLENGQPVGPQDIDTTEDGAYTITVMGEIDNSITRNPGASIFLTSEDEWYKAAYYDPLSANYFASTASSDDWTICAVPGATPNTANCDQVVGDVGDVTDVRSYTASASPNGTFDQGGNVSEWNEAILPTFPSTRGHRGGGYLFNFAPLLLGGGPGRARLAVDAEWRHWFSCRDRSRAPCGPAADDVSALPGVPAFAVCGADGSSISAAISATPLIGITSEDPTRPAPRWRWRRIRQVRCGGLPG